MARFRPAKISTSSRSESRLRNDCEMSHDIIIKQHGGSIEGETDPGLLPSSGSHYVGPANGNLTSHFSAQFAAAHESLVGT